MKWIAYVLNRYVLVHINVRRSAEESVACITWRKKYELIRYWKRDKIG